MDVTGINNLIKEKDGNIIKQVQENYYLVINNILTPVTLVRTDYENSFGAIIQEINIYNRLDNSVIPQEDVILFIG